MISIIVLVIIYCIYGFYTFLGFEDRKELIKNSNFYIFWIILLWTFAWIPISLSNIFDQDPHSLLFTQFAPFLAFEAFIGKIIYPSEYVIDSLLLFPFIFYWIILIILIICTKYIVDYINKKNNFKTHNGA